MNAAMLTGWHGVGDLEEEEVEKENTAHNCRVSSRCWRQSHAAGFWGGKSNSK